MFCYDCKHTGQQRDIRAVAFLAYLVCNASDDEAYCSMKEHGRLIEHYCCSWTFLSRLWRRKYDIATNSLVMSHNLLSNFADLGLQEQQADAAAAQVSLLNAVSGLRAGPGDPRQWSAGLSGNSSSKTSIYTPA